MLKKKEEVKRLKALKMKDIRSKLERIGKEGGKKVDETEGSYTMPDNTLVKYSLVVTALQELDLEGEWDSDAHDRQMSKIYGMDEDEFAGEEKPSWDDDIDIADIVPEEAEESSKKKKKKKKKKAEEEYGDGVDVDEMDADVAKEVDDEEWDGTEEMRKQKLDEYMDELYGLEFNDVVCTVSSIYALHLFLRLSHYVSPIGCGSAYSLQVHESTISVVRPESRGDSPSDRRRA